MQDARQADAVVFQDARLLPWKPVWRNVALGLTGADARGRAEAALKEVGLGHRLERLAAHPLRRRGPARRFGSRPGPRTPKLLLLDEPFAAVDALTRIRMHDLVLSLWRKHAPAVLLVTHDVDEAITLADRVLVLEEGRIAAEERIDLPRPRDGGPVFQAIPAGRPVASSFASTSLRRTDHRRRGRTGRLSHRRSPVMSVLAATRRPAVAGLPDLDAILPGLTARFAATADEHDRDASFPFENFDALHEAGLLALTAPKELGGHRPRTCPPP